MKDLNNIVEALGGFSNVAQICEISSTGVRKWLKAHALPRTEWTGETNYAERLSQALGGKLSKEEILKIAHPRNNQTANPAGRGKCTK